MKTTAIHMSSGRTQLRLWAAPCDRAGLLALLLALADAGAGRDDSARGLHQPSSASDLMLPPTVRM